MFTDLFEDEAVDLLEGPAIHIAWEGLVLGGQTATVNHVGSATRQETIVADDGGSAGLKTLQRLLREGLEVGRHAAVTPIRPTARSAEAAALIAHTGLRGLPKPFTGGPQYLLL